MVLSIASRVSRDEVESATGMDCCTLDSISAPIGFNKNVFSAACCCVGLSLDNLKRSPD